MQMIYTYMIVFLGGLLNVEMVLGRGRLSSGGLHLRGDSIFVNVKSSRVFGGENMLVNHFSLKDNLVFMN